jgi:hypothetical protein
MQPTINRETVLIDRRQPSLRWSAVFAGVACSVGFWMLLQLLGLGLGLAAIDVDNAGSLRGVGAGTTAWSLISPLIAMFLGGLLAGKLAQTHDRKVAGAHGVVMWAMTSILGLSATVWMVAMVAAGAARGGAAIDVTGRVTSSAGGADAHVLTLGVLGIDGADVLAPINQRLAAQGKPAITVAELEAAMRGVVREGLARGDFDQELLTDQLVASTQLARADALDVERQLEARVDPTDPRGHHIEHRVQRFALQSADAAGKALTIVGLSMLLSLITSVVGAVIALGRARHGGTAGPSRNVRITEPGFSPQADPVTTAPPYPTHIGPPSPVILPNDITDP